MTKISNFLRAIQNWTDLCITFECSIWNVVKESHARVHWNTWNTARLENCSSGVSVIVSLIAPKLAVLREITRFTDTSCSINTTLSVYHSSFHVFRIRTFSRFIRFRKSLLNEVWMALSKKRLLPNHTFRKKRFHIENRFPHGITHVREFFTWNHTSESFSRGITHFKKCFTRNHTFQRMFHEITHFRKCF